MTTTPTVERTLALIKSDAVREGLTLTILQVYTSAGLRVAALQAIDQVELGLAELHYGPDIAERWGAHKREQIIADLRSGPVVALVLEGVDAVARVRRLNGATDPSRADPTSIRARFSHDSIEAANAEDRVVRSIVHGSGNPKEAREEIALWFPDLPPLAEPAPAAPPQLKRRRLPDERRALTHKFSIAGHEGYITVGLYDDGTPGEIFLTMAKEGSTVSGLMDTVATLTSMALQYGVPLETLVEKFSHTRFEPAGYTKNPELPVAKSLVDYVFRYLASRFLGARSANPPAPTPLDDGEPTEAPPQAEQAPLPSAPPDDQCPNCEAGRIIHMGGQARCSVGCGYTGTGG